MATEVPQRALRNETGALLRRVEAGERLRVTVNGHPVADLVPLERSAELVGRESVLRQLGGVLGDDRTLMADIAAGVEGEPRVPFG